MENKVQKNNLKQIKGIRKKLHKAITKYGLNSKETRILSDDIDKKINEYYKSIEQIEYPKNSKIIEYRNKSYKAIKEITRKNKKFPTVKQWNKIAEEKRYLSNRSIEYVLKTNWNDLRTRVLRELNIEI